MANLLNHVDIMGRLTKDPEVRQSGDGKHVASFSIAFGEDSYIKVTAWNKTADFVSRFFFKGKMAVVSGRLRQNNWVDREGRKRSDLEITADSVYSGDSKGPLEDRTVESPKFVDIETEDGLPF